MGEGCGVYRFVRWLDWFGMSFFGHVGVSGVEARVRVWVCEGIGWVGDASFGAWF